MLGCHCGSHTVRVLSAFCVDVSACSFKASWRCSDNTALFPIWRRFLDFNSCCNAAMVRDLSCTNEANGQVDGVVGSKAA